MATVFRSVTVALPADAVWARVRRFDDPVALAPGFVTSCEILEGDRMVRFADGGYVREMLVSCDEERSRLSYAAVGGKARFHHAAMQVIAIDARSSRLEWTTDLLPDDVAPFVAARMDAGLEAIRHGMGQRGAAAAEPPG